MDIRKKLNKGRKHYTYIEVLSALSDYGNYLMGEPAENDFGSSQTVEDYINYNMWHDKKCFELDGEMCGFSKAEREAYKYDNGFHDSDTRITLNEL